MKASGWLQSDVTKLDVVLQCVFIVECAFSALRVLFEDHPHPQATSVPNFVSFRASVAELAHGEKSCTQSLNHPPSLFHAPEPKLLLRNSKHRYTLC